MLALNIRVYSHSCSFCFSALTLQYADKSFPMTPRPIASSFRFSLKRTFLTSIHTHTTYSSMPQWDVGNDFSLSLPSPSLHPYTGTCAYVRTIRVTPYYFFLSAGYSWIYMRRAENCKLILFPTAIVIARFQLQLHAPDWVYVMQLYRSFTSILYYCIRVQ